MKDIDFILFVHVTSCKNCPHRYWEFSESKAVCSLNFNNVTNEAINRKAPNDCPLSRNGGIEITRL
jgi:hypothetical protein